MAPNLAYGVAAAAAVALAALAVRWLWLREPLGSTARRALAGMAVGVGLAAGLSGG